MKCSLLSFPYFQNVLSKLFTKILFTNKFPKNWITGMLIPIHKKGPKSYVGNYRGIMLLSCLGKLFTAIINERLLTYLKEKNILANEQVGFMRGNRTSDNLIIIHTMIHENFKKGNKLFACFIDFEKAFDKVPRHLLLKKLEKCGIRGHTLKTIQSMYQEDKACIKICDKITDTFSINSGVKQGDNPSPTFFNLYLHDMPSLFKDKQSDPPLLIDGTPIGSLLWADDLVILSNSEKGLNHSLMKLGEYCESNLLTLNITKTKYMVFNKSGRTVKKNIVYRNKKIDYVRNFTYLGFCLDVSGNVKEGVFDLHKRAQKAFYKLKHQLGDMFYQKPKLTIKLFDSLIKPILLYCSDFWGCFESTIKETSPLETLNTTLCKQLLGVKKHTSNVACKLELGRYPLYIDAIKNCIKNWSRIHAGEACNMIQLVQKQFSQSNESIWTNSIKETLFKNGFGYIFCDKETLTKKEIDMKIPKIILRLKDCAAQNYFATIESQSKLTTYVKYKNEFKMEGYVTNSCFKARQQLSKLRLSDHKLEIEVGRYKRPKMPREKRTCPFCPNSLEDEYHFVATCPLYREEREQIKTEIFNNQNGKHPGLNDQKFFDIVFSGKLSNITMITKFISDITKLREENVEALDFVIIPFWLFNI